MTIKNVNSADKFKPNLKAAVKELKLDGGADKVSLGYKSDEPGVIPKTLMSSLSSGWTNGVSSVFRNKHVEPEESVRVDVYRKGQKAGEEIDPNDKGKYAPLAPVGVDLGMGLFLDINGNITFNPFRLQNQDFKKITVDPFGMGNATTITRGGDKGMEVTINRPGWGNKTEITDYGTKMRIKTPGMPQDTEITGGNGSARIKHPMYGFTTEVEKRGDATRLKMPGTFNDLKVTENKTGANISIPGMGNDFTLTDKGHGVTVLDTHGWGNSVAITRKGGKTEINPYGLGNSISITRIGDRVEVDPFGLGNGVSVTVSR